MSNHDPERKNVENLIARAEELLTDAQLDVISGIFETFGRMLDAAYEVGFIHGYEDMAKDVPVTHEEWEASCRTHLKKRLEVRQKGRPA